MEATKLQHQQQPNHHTSPTSPRPPQQQPPHPNNYQQSNHQLNHHSQKQSNTNPPSSKPPSATTTVKSAAPHPHPSSPKTTPAPITPPTTPPPLSPTPNTANGTPYTLPPPTRYQLPFPRLFEQWFAPFDDAIVTVCQRRTTGLVFLFSTTFTFFTSIEVSLIAPPTLYALGYDAAGGLCASVLLVLGVVSQMPKKFIFRPRPWMVSRAIPIRRDKTSSFPSRAVVCAVVFCWLFAWCILLERDVDATLNRPSSTNGVVTSTTSTVTTLTTISSISPFLLWPAIVCVAVLTAFARINVGAHYPSDTVLGFILGCIVVNLGTRLESLWRLVCDAPTSTPRYLSQPLTAYATSPTFTTHLQHAITLLTARPFLTVTAFSYAVTLASIQGFWVKCSYVYGLLLSSAAFRATYVCARRPASVARIVRHGVWWRHVRAGAPFAALLVFGMLIRGRKGSLFRVLSFTMIYGGALMVMLAWRLWPDGADVAVGGGLR